MPAKIAIATGSIVAIVVIAGLVSHFASSYLSQADAARNPSCSGTHADHKVTIKNDVASPGYIDAPQCDTLTIVNADQEDRLIAFGLHEKHEPYDGVTEKLLKQNQSLTVTLRQAGNFRFHDHIHDEVGGTFTVTPLKQ